LLDVVKRYDFFFNFYAYTKLLEIDASKYSPPTSKIAAYQVTDPTIRKYVGQISKLWVSSYQNPWSNLVGVLRCRIFFLASAPRLEMRAKDSTILGFNVGLNQTLGHHELKQ